MFDCTLKIGPGPDLAGAQGRAKSGRGQILLDPSKIAGVEKLPSPAEICSTPAVSIDFRPAQNCVGRLEAQIQGWGMRSRGFLMAPGSARPRQNCVGRAEICPGIVLRKIPRQHSLDQARVVAQATGHGRFEMVDVTGLLCYTM